MGNHSYKCGNFGFSSLLRRSNSGCLFVYFFIRFFFNVEAKNCCQIFSSPIHFLCVSFVIDSLLLPLSHLLFFSIHQIFASTSQSTLKIGKGVQSCCSFLLSFLGHLRDPPTFQGIFRHYQVFLTSFIAFSPVRIRGRSFGVHN